MKRKSLVIKDPVVSEYVNQSRQRLGDRLKNIYLFGSRARGDAWEGSDYDYALIVDVRDRILEDAILDVSTLLLDKFEVLVSTQIFTEQEWVIEHNLPLGQNIIKEGIAL
ncbi:MAG: nucleotidyltransferase domain-containing protein [Candidatus Zhuqueibacterota bacterium]